MVARAWIGWLGVAALAWPALAAETPQPARPTDSPGNWATDSDYPMTALRAGKHGEVRFRLTIGPDGVPTECVVIASAGDADLDATTCSLMMQRARFTPATDADGKPTRGLYTSTVHWRLPSDGPGDMPQKLRPYAVVISFDVETDGSPSHCKVEQSDGVPLHAVEMSWPCGKGRNFAPFVGKDGAPVRRHVVTTSATAITDAH